MEWCVGAPPEALVGMSAAFLKLLNLLKLLKLLILRKEMSFRRKRRGRAHCARGGVGRGAPQTKQQNNQSANQPNFQTTKQSIS